MLFCDRQVWCFCLLSLIWKGVWNFRGAPGSMTLKIRTPDYIDDCSEKNCRYSLQICIGSGRSEEERCLWFAGKEISNKLQGMQRYLADITFDVDNVGSTFFFNANLSFYEEKIFLKTERFKDSMFRFNEGGVSLYSSDFSVLKIDISIKCKPGFYPRLRCTEMCFDNPPVDKCDENGQKVCLIGYYYDHKTKQCKIDNCLKETNFCKNDGTCINEFDGIKCLCKVNFTGNTCEKWDPCVQNNCKNRAHCIKLEQKRDYICQCNENYYGRFCELYEDSCASKKCPPNSKCKAIANRPVCVSTKTVKSVRATRSPSVLSTKKMKIGSSTKEKKKNAMVSSQVDKETERFLQFYPYRNEYTTLVIVIVLVVFMVGCFSITFWILKIKYFQKKNKNYSNYPTLPVMPSIFNPSTYRSGDDNFRRWHSLDDNSFYMCNQIHPEPYHPYRSGSNIFQKQDLKMDSYPENYPSINSPHRMCQSMIRSRMPMLYEPSTVDSCDLNFTVTSISQNNSEKNEEMNNNYISVQDPSIIDV